MKSSFSFVLPLAAAAAMAIAPATDVRAADDIFLKIDGIEGESVSAKHKGEIEILSYSWGVSNSATIGSAGGGAGTGKAKLNELAVTFGTNKASPKLFQACATGQHIKSVVLEVDRAGKEQTEFLKITLTDVLVSSWQEGGADNGNHPTESATFNFSKVQFEYIPQNAKGSLDAPIKAGYDVKANVKL